MASPIFVILLVIAAMSMQIETASSCEDRNKKCKIYLSENYDNSLEAMCNAEKTKHWAWKYCRSTCNLCDQPAPCIDAPKMSELCEKHKDRCQTTDAKYKQRMEDNCRKTCGFCTSDETDDNEGSVDVRKRRSDAYVVEILVLVDRAVRRTYEKFGYSGSQLTETLRGDVKFFMSQVNHMYESLEKHGLKMEVRIKDILLLNEDVVRPYGDRLQAGTRMLDKVSEWVSNKGYYQQYKPDATILLTGYKFYSATGYAFMGTVCEERAVGVTNYQGLHVSATITAHELGHILGSEHDPQSSSSGIMVPTVMPDYRNRWFFSSQSAYYFQNKINSLDRDNKNCLTKTTTKPNPYDLGSQKGRDIMDVEKICIRSQEKTDTFFRMPNDGNVCRHIFCGKSRTDSYSTSEMPTEGIVCGVGKRCQKGECINAPSNFPTPKGLKEGCLFGDTKSLRIYSNMRGGCKVLGDRYCYQESFARQYCCETCAKQNKICKDKDTRCGNWARRGECQNNPNWMLPNCKKSCNQC